jgi:hypothetical protein
VGCCGAWVRPPRTQKPRGMVVSARDNAASCGYKYFSRGKLRAGHCRSQGAECWVCQTDFRGKQMKAPMARGSILWAECVQRRKKGEAGMAKKWLPPQLSLSHNTVCIRTVDGVSLSPAPAVALQRACSPTQTKGE